MKAILVCTDLIFSSKITGTAKELNVDISVALSTAGAVKTVTPDTNLVLVDLSNPANTSESDLVALKQALPATAKLIAYGSHVDIARLEAARRAGCDAVLPRSAFVQQLVDILSGT